LRHLDLPHSGGGWLDGNQVLSSGDEFISAPDAKLRVEPEVAIFLSKSVPPGCSLDEARDAIAGVSAALEVVDYSNAGAGFDDIVATSMFHAASVIGSPGPLETAEDLGRLWPTLRVGEVEAEAARDDLVPSDLAELVVFVSAFLAEFDERLEAGDFILSGSYTAKALPISPGQEARADHGPLGEISVRIRG